VVLAKQLMEAVLKYCNFAFETDLFAEEIEMERLTLEPIQLLSPLFDRYSTLNEEDAFGLQITASSCIKHCWGPQAQMRLEPGLITFIHPDGFVHQVSIDTYSHKILADSQPESSPEDIDCRSELEAEY
jgi:hypothetical protein